MSGAAARTPTPVLPTNFFAGTPIRMMTGGDPVRAARISTLHVGIAGVQQADASIASLSAALDGSFDRLPRALRKEAMALNESGDLFVCESADGVACGATILDQLKLSPSERYRELFAAIADELGRNVVLITHGWPVLSSVGDAPTIAEGEGSASALPGGRAA